ncbi:lysylphosphatidylglycerol synthase domain-containing protein [Longispora albida]|uniref:lysylphosphatidylglycerol synthase domain-containing protein n=1 Tax=Longispora albida TaxID=203523 RepID=UPI0003A51A69|nr:lysylphosphatidylglycerol synthase domain-containing protein [Longispora albida]
MIAETQQAAPPATGLLNTLRNWAVTFKPVLSVLRYLVIVVVAVAVAYATVRQWHAVKSTFGSLSLQAILLSCGAAVVGSVANMMAWRSMLREMGHRIPVIAAGQISCVAQLGKYVPGSVWAYVMQTELGRKAGLPRDRSLLASLIVVGLGITSGLMAGVLAVPALRANHSGDAVVSVALWSLALLLPIALVCSYPPVLNKLIGVFLKLVRAEPLPKPLSYAGVGRAFAWTALAWISFGLHVWLLIGALADPGTKGIGLAIGAMSIAMVVSIFAVILPSGIGVREGILVACLIPLFPGDTATAAGLAFGVALASRLISTVSDVIAAGGFTGAALWLRRSI